jgi:hypothetical protein
MSNPCWIGNHSSTGGAGKLLLWKNRKARTREKPGRRTLIPTTWDEFSSANGAKHRFWIAFIYDKAVEITVGAIRRFLYLGIF